MCDLFKKILDWLFHMDGPNIYRLDISFSF